MKVRLPNLVFSISIVLCGVFSLIAESRAFDCKIDRNSKLLDHRRALADCERLVALAPSNSWSYYHRGIEYDYLGSWKLALQDFNHALTLNPRNSSARVMRARITGSIADLDQAIRETPRWSYAYGVRACWRANHNDPRGACSDYSKAIELGSKDAFDFHGRACEYLDCGDLDRALDDIKTSIQMDPTNCWHYFVRGRIEIARREYRGAVKSFDLAIPKIPHGCSFAAFRYRGGAKLALGDWTGVLDYGAASIEVWCNQFEYQFSRIKNLTPGLFVDKLLHSLTR